jgi:FtsH-binding integral membrane protein
MSVTHLPAIEDRNPNIANNIFALLVTGGIGLAIVAGLALRARLQQAPLGSLTARLGYGAAGLVWLATLVAFYTDRTDFTQAAHYAAAVALFTCILVVVVLNALGWKRKKDDPHAWNRYAAVAVAMLAGTAGIGVAGLVGWAHWLLALEITLISLFALFWSLQTAELWHDGLR